jgi:hypothetical protein
MGDIPFDAIGSLLIFLIGIPALVIQSISPEIRHVVVKRWQWLLLDTGAPVVVAVVVVGLGLLVSWAGDWRWVLVVGALFLIATYTAIRILYRYGRRSVVIRCLEKEVFQSRAGRLIETSLVDLVELGKQSEPGQDKELVLESLYRLAARMCGLPGYRGDRLEGLILGLVDVLTANTQPGNAQNFNTAAQILQHITKSAKESSVDVLWAVQALGTLGQATLIHIGPVSIRATSMKYVQALGMTVHQHPANTTDVSQALFEVGVVAVRERQILIAMSALAELLILVQANKPAREELVTDLLGLSAHFWLAGDTAREYVRRRLAEIVDALATSLEEALEAARHHCAQTTQFPTADDLSTMIRDLRQTPLSIAAAPRQKSV